MIKSELHKLNEGTPRERLTLSSLLERIEGIIRMPTKPGQALEIPKAELALFAREFDQTMHGEIRIPLILISSGDAYAVSGNLVDQWVIERLVGYNRQRMLLKSGYEAKYQYYYSYQINKVKKKFPSIIQIVFSL
ncbi:MAG TPA: DUF61 family protein [Candidatus Hodarchaeales archaeon]|nr:DUF61 family protein [Candidatus Hodarchaeales archaeon]